MIVGDRISPQLLEQEWSRGGRTLAAHEAGRPVGTVTVWLEHKAGGEEEADALIGLLAVDPAIQGRGLGRLLLDAAEQTAAASGARFAAMWVLPCRAELRAFYARRGYELAPGLREPFPAGQGFGDPRPETLERYGGDVHFVKLVKRLG